MTYTYDVETFKAKFENDPRFSGLISNGRLFAGYVRDAQYQLSRVSRRNVAAFGHAQASLQAEENRSVQVERLIVDAAQRVGSA